MKRAWIIALVAAPALAGAAGLLLARGANASAGEGCAAPTLYVDIADGASLVTGGPNSIASCEGDQCRVVGPEQVEVQAEGRVQCVSVGEGQALALTRRGHGVAVTLQNSGR